MLPVLLDLNTAASHCRKVALGEVEAAAYVRLSDVLHYKTAPLTLFFGDFLFTWMVKTEFGVQGTCDLGSPFSCQWKTFGSDPADSILK